MPSSSDQRSGRVAAVAAVLLLMGLAAGIAIEFWGESYDDAFITYRYARNLVEGLGFVYNPGEQILGTTAPGWAFLLAAGTVLGRPIGIEVPAVGTLLSLVALLYAASWLWRRRGLVTATLFGVAALAFPWHLELLGAEGFAVIAAVLAMHHQLAKVTTASQIYAGVLGAAAVALRPTAALAVGLLLLAALVWELLQLRRSSGQGSASLRPALWRTTAFLVPTTLFYGALYFRTGRVLPQSYSGKRAEGDALGAGIDYTIRQLAWLDRLTPTPLQLVLAALAVVGVIQLLRLARQQRFLERTGALDIGLLTWPLALELFYRAVSVPFAPWYHLPTTTALLALSAIGTVTLCRWLANRVAARAQPGSAAPWLASVVTATLLWGPAVAHDLRWWQALDGQPVDARMHVYRQAGELLASIEEQGDVAALEIGFLGWHSRRPILDLSGLVSPEVLVDRSTRSLEDVLRAEQPRFILEASLFDEQAPLGTITRGSCYQEIERMQDVRGGRGTVRVLRATGEGC